MPRSLANGDYSLVIAIESSSRANSWYRVLADRHTGNLSCDCPIWIYNQEGGAVRSCKHTRLAQRLASIQTQGQGLIANLNSNLQQSNAQVLGTTQGTGEHPLIQATRQQWPGLGGRWSLEQRRSTLDGTLYDFVLLRLLTGNGVTATGVVTFFIGRPLSDDV